jgi:hypothetical protein
MQLNSGPSPIEPEKERNLISLYQCIATNSCLIKQFSQGKTKQKMEKTESVLSLNDIVYEEEKKLTF